MMIEMLINRHFNALRVATQHLAPQGGWQLHGSSPNEMPRAPAASPQRRLKRWRSPIHI
jgi:hypothetical protein